ncbi:hypothetical protein Taro_012893 [Colocasia esculenta]|uniref:Uncharacterized protein n=1 Tax=Colocasia esculenta TaxID=4460 RepID=A0A843UAE3_COLES|nr:hypothetical protein [Colocasia esculenta]
MLDLSMMVDSRTVNGRKEGAALVFGSELLKFSGEEGDGVCHRILNTWLLLLRFTEPPFHGAARLAMARSLAFKSRVGFVQPWRGSFAASLGIFSWLVADSARVPRKEDVRSVD